jgi:hypothetical protein
MSNFPAESMDIDPFRKVLLEERKGKGK